MSRLLILLGFMGILLSHSAHTAEMVNVEYIHLLIEQKWGVSIPYNPSVTNPKVAANMEYLLGMVDITNKRLNGTATTDYLHSEYATKQAADTDASIDATNRLIKIESKFFVTTTNDTAEFEFTMSARGTFQIEWGDGTKDIIKRTNTTETAYRHTYATAGAHTIGIGGRATGYGTSYNAVAISFASNKNVAGISGSLGAVFATVGDGRVNGQQPRFYQTFYNCTNLAGDIPGDLFAGVSGVAVQYMFFCTFDGCSNLTSIPETLFAEISGAPAYHMFFGTFAGCSNLTSIPENLFAGISGAPASNMFGGTFAGCCNLTTIPANLFAGIKGAPATYMFQRTFEGCRSLTSIPEGLFAGIKGAPAGNMFYRTFFGCSNLTSIPENLFAGIFGAPADSMFSHTFYNCGKLTSIPEKLFGNISGMARTFMFGDMFYGCTSLAGLSARINGKYLYEIWPDANTEHVVGCYSGDTNLDDYTSIPAEWK